MLNGHAKCASLERTHTTNPLVGHNGQRVLITSKAGVALVLFWRHIGRRADLLLRTHQCAMLDNLGNAKITEQDCTVLT